ncbi:FeoB-associated Cys-rich membrane protein [Prosthecobacter vanneervenii]|uniref:Uncharacterized protein n=1 Tax=Prosthecobacter vanneervenii TaxID=48466 RepID=A0A7W8DJM5_9BACT|nr:FeoB-associated Cys-rich membrane protein [Prosthecobacter vanneervenii]MBB5032237.1 hypothetical protein [Prosthecobacter vanneervenii]
MNQDWQSIAAIAVVLVTAVLFIARSAKRRKKPGCGGSCGCGK